MEEVEFNGEEKKKVEEVDKEWRMKRRRMMRTRRRKRMRRRNYRRRGEDGRVEDEEEKGGMSERKIDDMEEDLEGNERKRKSE